MTVAGGGVASPCINVCRMEGEYCAGCFRSIAEIAAWSRVGDAERRLILAAVAQRRARLDPEADLRGDCRD